MGLKENQILLFYYMELVLNWPPKFLPLHSYQRKWFLQQTAINPETPEPILTPLKQQFANELIKSMK